MRPVADFSDKRFHNFFFFRECTLQEVHSIYIPQNSGGLQDWEQAGYPLEGTWVNS